MSQTKTFYLERGPINPPELHPANEDELIKIYASNDDAMTDLANMDDNEVFATRDNDYLGAVIVDKVEDGNYNPLTSNAVFDYIQDQIEMSNYETVTVSTNSASPSVASYDGIVYIVIDVSSGSSGTAAGCSVVVNGSVITKVYAKRSEMDGNNSFTLKKGDSYYIILGNNVHVSTSYARWYKLRDYSRRS